jgi:hypothetical protein
MDLRDLEGNDLIEISAGLPISIGLEPYTTDLLEGQTEGQRFQTLANLGFDTDVAKTIATGFDTLNIFKKPFRLKEATLEFGKDDGLHITAVLQNFVNITGEAP